MSEEGAPTGQATGPRRCAWCASPASDDATTCGSCGAALAQRESIGDLRIPGLTAIDPALEDFDKRPMHLRGPSSSQGVAPALIVGAAAGGPIGAVLIGGVVAVAAAEYLGGRQPRTGGVPLDDVGRPSEAALQALAREGATTEGTEPEAAATEREGPAEPGREQPSAAAADNGMSIWRDLPPQPTSET